MPTTMRTAVLLNFIAPYRRPFLEQLQAQLGDLRILLSTPMEANREWKPDWGALDVIVQKTLTIATKLVRSSGIRQQVYLHLSLDTLPLLFRFNPELLISGEFGMRSLQAAVYRTLFRRCRLIIWATLSEHTEKDWGIVRRTLRRFILGCSDAVLVNGQSGARYIATLNSGIPVITMWQPASIVQFARSPINRDPASARRLIYSGRLIRLKGVLEAQAMIARWADCHPETTVEMIWAGDGDMRGALERTVVPANFQQVFCGNVDYDELARLYATSGALILPTMLDEWGLVVNEALASGIPVLGSVYSQAVEELVTDGSNGWLFDPLHPASLTRALDLLFTVSPDTLAEMRGCARRVGLAITPERAAEQLVIAVHALPQPARPWKSSSVSRRSKLAR